MKTAKKATKPVKKKRVAKKRLNARRISGIETGIPVPEYKRIRRKESIYPIRSLKVTESFSVRLKDRRDDPKRIVSTVNSCINRAKKEKAISKDWDYTYRYYAVKRFVRFWRIK